MLKPSKALYQSRLTVASSRHPFHWTCKGWLPAPSLRLRLATSVRPVVGVVSRMIFSLLLAGGPMGMMREVSGDYHRRRKNSRSFSGALTAGRDAVAVGTSTYPWPQLISGSRRAARACNPAAISEVTRVIGRGAAGGLAASNSGFVLAMLIWRCCEDSLTAGKDNPGRVLLAFGPKSG